MFNRKKPVIEFKRHHANGFLPRIALHYQVLDKFPAISLATFGRPKNSALNRLMNKVRELTGYPYSNPIECLYYYDGSNYSYPFHLTIHYKDFRPFYSRGNPPIIAKNAKSYEIQIFDPLTKMQIYSGAGDLKYWNARISRDIKNQIGDAIKDFEDKYFAKFRLTISNDRKNN